MLAQHPLKALSTLSQCSKGLPPISGQLSYCATLIRLMSENRRVRDEGCDSCPDPAERTKAWR
jgi:hypothetical protein